MPKRDAVYVAGNILYGHVPDQSGDTAYVVPENPAGVRSGVDYTFTINTLGCRGWYA